MTTEIRQIIEESPFFSGIDQSLMKKIAASVVVKTLARGEFLFQKGERSDALWGVIDGRVLTELRAEDGKELLLDEFLPGEIFGEVGVLDFGPRPVSARAACKSKLIRLNRAHLLEYLQTSPELCFRVFSLLCTNLRNITETLEDTALYKLPNRLAKRLVLMLHEESSCDSDKVLQVVQSELARMMGVNREAVNRQLKEWEKSGWINISRQKIRIVDEQALTSLAAPVQKIEGRNWGLDSFAKAITTQNSPDHNNGSESEGGSSQYVSILAINCIEYAGLLKTDSVGTIKRVKAGLAAVNQAIEGNKGQVIWNAGERILAAFSSNTEALDAALEIQRQTGDPGTTHPAKTIFRIGIHSGNALKSNGLLIGDPINIAIRLTELHGSGGILISEEVSDDIKESRDRKLQYLGKHKLKTVPEPVSLFAVRKIPLLKRAALRASTVMPARYRPALVAAAALLTAAIFWISGDRMVRQDSPPVAGQISIAVLPFTTGGGSELDYLAHGIPRDIRTSLSGAPALRVIGIDTSNYFTSQRSSVLNFQQVEEELEVMFVLDGDIRKAGDHIEVFAKLVRTHDGLELWKDNFDGNTYDLFEIQGEISSNILNALSVSNFGNGKSRHAVDREAYALYMKGQYFEYLAGRTNQLRAYSAYQQALSIDPDFASALVGLSRTYTYRGPFNELPREESFQLALDAANKAIATGDQLSQAWCQIGWLRVKYAWDWDGADEAFKRSMQHSQNNNLCYGARATLAWTLGQSLKELRLREKEVELDPLRLPGLSALGQTYIRNGRPEEALELFKQIIEINPDFPLIHEKVGLAYLVRGDAEMALAEFNNHRSSVKNILNKASAHVALGQYHEARVMVDEYLATNPQNTPFWTAAIYAWLGDNDQAFNWLETSLQQRDVDLSTILTNSYLAGLQNDPRYAEILKKMDLWDAWMAMRD